MVAALIPALRVELSARECWQLYEWLGEHAPFVRNQLRVIRQGGGGDVRLATREERQEVLQAIEIGCGSLGSLTSGLRSLKMALAESDI